MDIVKKNDLKELMEVRDEPCISIYMPTHRVGREQQQDPIRLKNLLAAVERRLLDAGHRKPDVDQILAPAADLLDGNDFWQHQSSGLAVFLSKARSEIYRLPRGFEELAEIADRFHLKPLLPLLSEDRPFYILALSINQVRLFRGTQETIAEVRLEGVPTDLQEALWADDPEKHVSFHTGTSGAGQGGMRRAMFYGQGGEPSEEKTNLLRYFQKVDRGLNDLLDDQTAPLVLAGVAYLLPIYHTANTYPNLVKEGLEGNPDEASAQELHRLAWDILAPLFDEDRKDAEKRLTRLKGQESDLAATDLETVVKAASFGQVDTLFVPLNVQVWGRYDSMSNRVRLDEAPGTDNIDLLDYAAMHTLMNSGRVYALEPEEMPVEEDVAAILRYAA